MQGSISRHLLRDIYEDLIQRLVDLCSEENIFISQPSRDNTLYLLRLVDEMLISEIDHELPVFNSPRICYVKVSQLLSTCGPESQPSF